MSIAEFTGKGRPQGRRTNDLALRGPRPERRRQNSQTVAAAQSVVMARLAEKAEAAQMKVAQAADAYAKGAPEKTPEQKRADERAREAELIHQAAQKAWVFDRRRGDAPRSTDIEDAEILD